MEKFYLLFLYFYIYSIIGWTLEVIYCRLLEGKFTNRGFLHGPYCPIYGTGAILIVIFLNRFYNNPALVFILGIIVTSILEYITSFIMEKLFNAKWWDYSNMKFNIKGRVCLLNSTLFGVLSLLLVYILNPAITMLIEKINPKYIPYISNILIILMSIDITSTVAEIINLKKKLSELREFTETLLKEKSIFSENSQTYKSVLDLREKIINKKNVINNRIIKAFPSLNFKENHFELLNIKELKRKFKNKK